MTGPHFPRPGTRPILGPWRNAPTAIRPSIRKRTRPSRPAPRRRGGYSALDPSLADILNPAIGHGRAGVGSQTGSPSPLVGEGRGVGRRSRERRRLREARRQMCVASRPPPLSPPHKGEGKSERPACSSRRTIRRSPRRFLRCASGAEVDTRKISRRVGRAAAMPAYVAKGPAERSIRNWPMRSAMATAIRPGR